MHWSSPNVVLQASLPSNGFCGSPEGQSNWMAVQIRSSSKLNVPMLVVASHGKL